MMILILEYEGESAQSKAGILADAEALQRKLTQKKNKAVFYVEPWTSFQNTYQRQKVKPKVNCTLYVMGIEIR